MLLQINVYYALFIRRMQRVFSIHKVHASLCVWLCERKCINVRQHKIYSTNACTYGAWVLSLLLFLLLLLLPLWLSYFGFGFLANGNTLYINYCAESLSLFIWLYLMCVCARIEWKKWNHTVGDGDTLELEHKFAKCRWQNGTCPYFTWWFRLDFIQIVSLILDNHISIRNERRRERTWLDF